MITDFEHRKSSKTSSLHELHRENARQSILIPLVMETPSPMNDRVIGSQTSVRVAHSCEVGNSLQSSQFTYGKAATTPEGSFNRFWVLTRRNRKAYRVSIFSRARVEPVPLDLFVIFSSVIPFSRSDHGSFQVLAYEWIFSIPSVWGETPKQSEVASEIRGWQWASDTVQTRRTYGILAASQRFTRIGGLWFRRGEG